MATIVNANQSDQVYSLNGLNTLNITIPVAGLYTVQGNLTLPLLRDGAQSQCIVTITQNATGRYTGIAGATGFQVPITAAAGDVIHVALSSSAAVDAGINAVAGNVQVFLTPNAL